jgi:hypothetical protein
MALHTAFQVQDEIAKLLRRLADPVVAGESVKACIRRASMRAGITHGQTKRLWYSEMSMVPAFLADQIRERAAAHDRKLKASMVEALAAMQASDPDFYRSAIETLSDALLPIGNVARNKSDKV